MKQYTHYNRETKKLVSTYTGSFRDHELTMEDIKMVFKQSEIKPTNTQEAATLVIA